ncbi:lytic transglycosylase domain-containing protein [Trinickia sp. EG282A]|uniref:lytic transglycosylase domain-containing protein n=1 Tax=Trinickia sp. EG282A TaxID=3237013 RepID=UPI0034D287A4
MNAHVRAVCAGLSLATGFVDITPALADESPFNAPLVWETGPTPSPPTVSPTIPPRATSRSARSLQPSIDSGRQALYDPLIASVANGFGLDAGLLHAIVRTESGYDASAVSSKAAIGLMQVMPATGRRFGFEDLHDPRENLSAGAAYLRWLLDRFGNDLELALAAYNAGENAVERYGSSIPPFPETRQYVDTVIARYRNSQSQAQPTFEARTAKTASPALHTSKTGEDGNRQAAISLTPLKLLEKAGSLMLSAPPSPKSSVP